MLTPLFAGAAAMPINKTLPAMKMPSWVNEKTLCSGGLCNKPNMEYERIADIQAGYQWNDAGGYCGSWATQRAVLGKGAWLSQQQVRDHTSPCGGHDDEILSCNIEEAWTNLKIDYEAFATDKIPTPQTAAYSKWLKKQLTAGHTIAWMIMWDGQSYPIYDLTPPEGMCKTPRGQSSNSHERPAPRRYTYTCVNYCLDRGPRRVRWARRACHWHSVEPSAQRHDRVR